MNQIDGANLLAMRSLAMQAKDSAITTSGNMETLLQHYIALQAENLRLREALEADRPKGIAEKFATLVKKKDGWYRGIIDYKIENGEVTRVGELKVTLVGEQSPSVFFKQEAKGPPFPDPAIEDKWDLTWPSLKTQEKRGCRKRLAPGQWWTFCGETDMGQTAPALCTECGGEFKLEPVRQE